MTARAEPQVLGGCSYAATLPAYADFLARHGVTPTEVRTFADFERLPLTTKEGFTNIAKAHPLGPRRLHTRSSP